MEKNPGERNGFSRTAGSELHPADGRGDFGEGELLASSFELLAPSKTGIVDWKLKPIESSSRHPR
jgi:hypothetical protein